MRVLSLLSKYEFHRLQRVAPSGWRLSAVDVASALERLAANSGGVIVFDPSEFAEDVYETVLARAAMAGARVVMYGNAAQIGVRPLLRCRERAQVELCAGEETASASVVVSLVGISLRSVAARVLDGLSGHLLRLPEPFARVVLNWFSFCRLPRSLATVCDGLGIHQTTVGVWCRRAGLICPSGILQVARVSRGCQFAMSGERSTDRVRIDAGFGSRDALERAFRNMLGRSYSAVLQDFDPDEISGTLIRRTKAGG